MWITAGILSADLFSSKLNITLRATTPQIDKINTNKMTDKKQAWILSLYFWALGEFEANQDHQGYPNWLIY